MNEAHERIWATDEGTWFRGASEVYETVEYIRADIAAARNLAGDDRADWAEAALWEVRGWAEQMDVITAMWKCTGPDCPGCQMGREAAELMKLVDTALGGEQADDTARGLTEQSGRTGGTDHNSGDSSREVQTPPLAPGAQPNCLPAAPDHAELRRHLEWVRKGLQKAGHGAFAVDIAEALALITKEDSNAE